MRSRTLALMLALAATPALAQAPQPAAEPDPIAALLQQQDQRPPPAPASPSAEALRDAALDSRIRASMASVQRFQGALDGGWTLIAGNAELYALQLSDRGKGVVEGAWRDLRRPGALNASGFIDAVELAGSDMTVRFGDRTAVLHGTADGRWSGELTEAGRTQAVTLRRKP